MADCALGFKVHSGWAALVALEAVSKSDPAPRVVARSRVEIADPAIEGSRQPYHAAEGLALPEAARYLEECERASLRRARVSLAAAIEEVSRSSRAPGRCAILLASGRPLPELAKVLASHALIHTADGEHFRAALAEAAESCGLEVVRLRDAEAKARVAERLAVGAAELDLRIASWRQRVGSPWASDQKLAAVAAWAALC